MYAKVGEHGGQWTVSVPFPPLPGKPDSGGTTVSYYPTETEAIEVANDLNKAYLAGVKAGMDEAEKIWTGVLEKQLAGMVPKIARMISKPDLPGLNPNAPPWPFR